MQKVKSNCSRYHKIRYLCSEGSRAGYSSELEAININHSKSISYSLLYATRRMQQYIGEAVFTVMSNNTFEEFLQSKKKGSIVISNVYIQKTKSPYFHKQDDFKRERIILMFNFFSKIYFTTNVFSFCWCKGTINILYFQIFYVKMC